MSKNLLQGLRPRSQPYTRREVAYLIRAAALASELCNAIDAAEEDIGGHRDIKQILGELGPACDKVEG